MKRIQEPQEYFWGLCKEEEKGRRESGQQLTQVEQEDKGFIFEDKKTPEVHLIRQAQGIIEGVES